jgi:putative tryptophan/tyrosine transport system substrate-binding protein
VPAQILQCAFAQQTGMPLAGPGKFDDALGDDSEQTRKYAAELIALAPDVILAVATSAAEALQQPARNTPMVFVQVTDPVGAGLVESLARPGGNVTGFTPFEYGISAKWLELLKEVAPRVRRMAVLREALLTSAIAQFAAMQSVASSLGVELNPFGVRDANEIERAIGGSLASMMCSRTIRSIWVGVRRSAKSASPIMCMERDAVPRRST